MHKRIVVAGAEEYSISSGDTVTTDKELNDDAGTIHLKLPPTAAPIGMKKNLLVNLSSMFIKQSGSLNDSNRVRVLDDDGNDVNQSKPIIVKILLSNWTSGFMGIVTVFALYGEDIKLASLPKSSDDVIAAFVLITFALFLLEMILTCYINRKYFASFFFWLDLIATISLLADVPFVLEGFGVPLELQSATDVRAGRAARAGTKAGRIVRLVRLVRVINLFKIGLKKKDNAVTKSETKKSEATPSVLGLTLSSMITRKVILGVLCMIFAIPALQSSSSTEMLPSVDVIDMLERSGQQTLIDDFVLIYESNSDKKVIYLLLNDIIVLNKEERLGELRISELEVIESSSSNSMAIFDMKSTEQTDAQMSMLLTTFLIVMLASLALAFSKDISALVILPIERMVERVRSIAEDPLNSSLLEDENDEVEEKFETKMLDTTIRKIVGLLALGFGEAGREVIRQHLAQKKMSDDIATGRKVHAIFGFCDIRNFTDTTECLQEDVMKFTNHIAQIVHEHTHFYGGSCNKNIGDAFLLCWKVTSSSKTQSMSVLADNALLAFLKIIADINRSRELTKYSEHPLIKKRFTNFKVRLGFGLHVGWAIEGAIGSRFKIDASYLSPNVNMAARLESGTKQFGVNILLSNPFHHLLSTHAKERCRQIDTVTVKGSIQPMGLFTYDTTNDKPMPQPKLPKQMPLTDQEIAIVWKTDSDILGLQRGLHTDLLLHFQQAFSLYSSGDWSGARDKLQICLKLQASDGPSTSLMRFMAKTNFVSPEDWEGCRGLDEK